MKNDQYINDWSERINPISGFPIYCKELYCFPHSIVAIVYKTSNFNDGIFNWNWEVFPIFSEKTFCFRRSAIKACDKYLSSIGYKTISKEQYNKISLLL